MLTISLLRLILLFLIGFGLFEGTSYALSFIERRRLKIRKKSSSKGNTIKKTEIVLVYISVLIIYLGILFLLIKSKIRGLV